MLRFLCLFLPASFPFLSPIYHPHLWDFFLVVLSYFVFFFSNSLSVYFFLIHMFVLYALFGICQDVVSFLLSFFLSLFIFLFVFFGICYVFAFVIENIIAIFESLFSSSNIWCNISFYHVTIFINVFHLVIYMCVIDLLQNIALYTNSSYMCYLQFIFFLMFTC